ncbi:hypothetical protein J4210_02455 [Candidatus Woesearchaeota archaeon]|nr:hypothetical protein [Candidatus Woesearchaeota archaeon]
MANAIISWCQHTLGFLLCPPHLSIISSIAKLRPSFPEELLLLLFSIAQTISLYNIHILTKREQKPIKTKTNQNKDSQTTGGLMT